jgi:hypothetical protein
VTLEPKVLIISNNPISVNTNNGKTISSFFGNFNKNSLSQIYFRDYGLPDYNRCTSYFRINEFDIIKNKLVNKPYSTNLNNFDSTLLNDKLFINFKIFKSFSIFHLLRNFIWLLLNKNEQNLNKWLTKQKPDLIFFVAGGDKFAHDFALFIKQLINKPLFVYFTDDYILNYKPSFLYNIFPSYNRLNFFQKTIQNACELFVIGTLMSKDYNKYFGREFAILINTIEENKNVKFDLTNKLPIIISYFGSLHTGRLKMLNRFSSLIPDKYKTLIEIHLYTSDIFSNTHFDKIIKFKGEVTGLDLIHAMKESDIFLHLESDSYKDILKTYYSISTKIPEYMINKKPILAFGPAKIASFRLLSENNIGFILESNLPNNLIYRKLIDFLDNFNLRKKLSESAYYYALSHFDNYKIRNEFELKIKKYTTCLINYL